MLRLASASVLAAFLAGCGALVAPLEQSLLYRPRPANTERMNALAAAPHTEEVRIATLAATGHRLVEWREAYWRVIAEFLGSLQPPDRLSLAR